MRAKLKYKAYAGRVLYGPGVVENWPDDVPLPNSAVALDSAPVEEEEEKTEEEKAPETLSELAAAGGKKTKL